MRSCFQSIKNFIWRTPVASPRPETTPLVAASPSPVAVPPAPLQAADAEPPAAAAAAVPQHFLEFGFCGIDRSAPVEVWRRVLEAVEGEAGGIVRFVAAFQLAYQGFPWNPTPEYMEWSSLEGRRYGGLVYPSWSEVDAYVRDLPMGTPLSFHLNETPKCPYVSGLLRGDPDMRRLVKTLVEQYNARHIQVNLTAHGVPGGLCDGASEESEKAAEILQRLCADFPDTIFIVPISRMTKPDGSILDTMAFFKQLLAVQPVPANLCGFFDSSAGAGIEPDAAPEIPKGYPTGPHQFVGFTGGIHAGNAKTWLDRYALRAREHGCRLISDAQSGFRMDRSRGKPVDVAAVLELSLAVREWAAQAAKLRGSCPTIGDVMPLKLAAVAAPLPAAAAAPPQQFLEFGFCGIDQSAPVDVWRRVLEAVEGEAGGIVRFVAAFQLAYQGFPWHPTPEYMEGSSLEGRRYGGLVYPSWSEVDAYVRGLPMGTPLSFHLNETPKCPYVSGLLRGDADMRRLVKTLVEQYNARHIQVNLTAHGVPGGLYDGASEESEKAAEILQRLCADFPDTIFIVPISRMTKPDGSILDTMAFFKQLLAVQPVPANLCGFFDSSAGAGIEPDAAPEIPKGYPTGPHQFVGFTGGIHAGNAKTWLDRYALRAREHGCRLISDAQSGFRMDRSRGKPVDVAAVLELSLAVREWAAEAAKLRGSCPTIGDVMPLKLAAVAAPLAAAAAVPPRHFLEFGFCGVDRSAPVEVWRRVLEAVEGEAGGIVRFVAAFQLAYQGFPWHPTPEYMEGSSLEGRRYGGLVYPSWSEVDAYVRDLPMGTPLSFHLNETPKCPYVSGLLRGDPDMRRLVKTLVEQYNARHIQVNLTAHGVPGGLCDGASEESEKAADILQRLCAEFPDTIFIVPISRMTKPDGSILDTMAFFKQLLAVQPVPANLCGFFDSSAGAGIEPDAAPEIPKGYPTGPHQFVGFTGGIHAGNAKTWLDRYAVRGREHGCMLISDAQSGFRMDRSRGKPVDVAALLELSMAVREWAAEAAKLRGSCPTIGDVMPLKSPPELRFDRRPSAHHKEAARRTDPSQECAVASSAG